MKKVITESLIILGIAILIGFSYNSILPDGKALSWTPKDKKVPDTTLFSNAKGKHKLPDAKAGEILEVTYNQMLRIVDNPDFFIIDARLEDMYEEAHIGDAINIYPYWDSDRILMALQEVPYDKTIVVYCDGGACDLSHLVAETLEEIGIEKIFLYIGGWEEWVKKQNIQ